MIHNAMLLCFECDAEYCVENFDITKRFKNKYGEWDGELCRMCGNGDAKLIGQDLKIGGNDWDFSKREERDKHSVDMIQRFRQGELSKEFVDHYPKQTAQMVKEGSVTQEQVKKAKNVWKGDLKVGQL